MPPVPLGMGYFSCISWSRVARAFHLNIHQEAIKALYPIVKNNLNSLNDLQNLFFNSEYVHFEQGEKRFKHCTVKRRSKDVSHLLGRCETMGVCFTIEQGKF